MKLTNLLVRLGLVYGGPAEGQDPPAAVEPSRPVFQKVVRRLEDMRAEDRAAGAEAEEAALGLHRTFAEIYREAGLGEPPGGLSLEELDRQVKGLSEEEARVAVLATLQEKGAPVREVLLDGHRRDVALDRYEADLEVRVADWERAAEDRARALLREARELEERARQLQERIPAVKQELAAWKARKHEEEDLFELLGRMLADGSAGAASEPGTGS